MTRLKKLILLILAVGTTVACNDDDDTGLPNNFVYLKENTLIRDGQLQGSNLHFYGTSTVTDSRGDVITDKRAYFEFAGLKQFTLYMHRARFAAGMPAADMRLSDISYTATGDRSIAFAVAQITPEVLRANAVGGGASYRPVEEYLITSLDGAIDDLACRVSFTCAGEYDVLFEGRLIGNR